MSASEKFTASAAQIAKDAASQHVCDPHPISERPSVGDRLTCRVCGAAVEVVKVRSGCGKYGTTKITLRRVES